MFSVETRLLPWASPEGKPCFLSSDGNGYLSKVADNVESMQLGMAGDLLDHAADMLADRKATSDQLRFLLARMSEALTDVMRVADSRGARMAGKLDDPDLIVDDPEDDGEDDGDGGPQLQQGTTT
ncbi:hypothetical protein AB0H86_37730 [Streptomyces sp. NPDC050997]|uniref:hypothetical protein n=1 Tax=Streptomyces sp. NPDC050997 TaxID=3155519 RepID=UPI003418B7E4